MRLCEQVSCITGSTHQAHTHTVLWRPSGARLSLLGPRYFRSFSVFLSNGGNIFLPLPPLQSPARCPDFARSPPRVARKLNNYRASRCARGTTPLELSSL